MKVPILTHTGRNNENFFKPLDRSVRQYSEPASWLPIVTSYPKIDFVFDHFAGAQDYWDDALKLLSYPNAYTDFARMVSVLSPKTIIKFIKAVGAEKIMYGSDYPGHNALKDIEQIKALDVSEEAKRAILGDNAARVYHLD